MNKQIRNRTWKYFFEQKIEEIAEIFGLILLIFGGVFLLMLIVYLLGIWGCNIGNGCNTTDVADYILIGTGGFFLISMGALMLWGIFYKLLFEEWLVPNWNKAKKRAKKDFKRKKK